MRPLFYLGLVPVIAGLLAGCGTRTIEIKAKPEVAALTPAKQRLTDPALKQDLSFLDSLQARAKNLPETSPVRAEALLWVEAARAEYLRGSWHPWVDEAAQHARRLIAGEAVAGPGAPASWIAHVRETRGFRAALPLIERAGDKGGSGAPVLADARPRDLTDEIYESQTRLAALHDLAGVSVHNYAWAKAQAWLDFAIAQHHIRDRSGVVRETQAEARKLVELLEASRNREPGATLAREGWFTRVGYSGEPDLGPLTTPAAIVAALDAAVVETPRLGSSRRAPENFRADLWTVAAAAPAGAERARLELAIIHAAHERGQGGRASSRPYEIDAERIAAILSPQSTVTP